MTETRRCVGSTRLGIEAHDASIGDFSAQPSQRDGLSRMCSVHWKQYVAGLAREAKERKAAATASDIAPEPAASPEPSGKRGRERATAGAEAGVALESAAE